MDVKPPSICCAETPEHAEARDHEDRGPEQRHNTGEELDGSGRPVHSCDCLHR